MSICYSVRVAGLSSSRVFQIGSVVSYIRCLWQKRRLKFSNTMYFLDVTKTDLVFGLRFGNGILDKSHDADFS